MISCTEITPSGYDQNPEPPQITRIVADTARPRPFENICDDLRYLRFEFYIASPSGSGCPLRIGPPVSQKGALCRILQSRRSPRSGTDLAIHICRHSRSNEPRTVRHFHREGGGPTGRARAASSSRFFRPQIDRRPPIFPSSNGGTSDRTRSESGGGP